ncbi:DedA family protein [Neorhizobium galegae]|nr:DedA family protein [Neorhizobium galegae]
MAEQLVILINEQGAVALFLILMLNCFGVPFPTSLIMLAIGSFVEQEELTFLPFFTAGLAGAAAGDQSGYLLGRMASTRLFEIAGKARWLKKALQGAEKFENRWGDAGIFLSRWLLSPLGPWINVFAGMNGYSWIRFSTWGILGEAVWVAGYMGLGLVFSKSVQMVSDLLGNVTWLILSVLAALLLGWKLISNLTRKKQRDSE